MRKFECVVREVRRTAIVEPLKKNAVPAYFNAEGQPCCIFGRALERLGVGMGSWEPLNIVSINELPWNQFGFESPSDFQANWCSRVQVAADNGRIWISAVIRADLPLN